MPEDAPLNSGAPGQPAPAGSWSRVSEMQAKLHRWAAADHSRRFGDLFNFVHDPARPSAVCSPSLRTLVAVASRCVAPSRLGFC